MALNLTLKPFERVVVNGCMMRNGGRKSTITVETRADIIRETDLLKPDSAATPVRVAYYLIQTALIHRERREALSEAVTKQLAALARTFSDVHAGHAIEAANNIAKSEYFTALRNLRPLLQREEELLKLAPVPEDQANLGDTASSHARLAFLQIRRSA